MRKPVKTVTFLYNSGFAPTHGTLREVMFGAGQDPQKIDPWVRVLDYNGTPGIEYLILKNVVPGERNELPVFDPAEYIGVSN